MHSTAIRIISIVLTLASAVLILLNLVTNRTEFWAIWPIWAFTMIAAAAIMSLKLQNVPLGIWLGGGAMLIVGLVAIDIADSDQWWAFWPAGVWLILGAVFTALTFDLLAGIPTSDARPPDEPQTGGPPSPR